MGGFGIKSNRGLTGAYRYIQTKLTKGVGMKFNDGKKEKIREVISLLEDLSNKIYPYPLNKEWGMCGAIRNLPGYLGNNLDTSDDIPFMRHRATPRWEHFSGDILYPVATTDDPCKEYWGTVDMWADNEYGDLRREYCKWYAKQLRIKLKQEKAQ